MRKIISLIMVIIVAFSIASCKKDEPKKGDTLSLDKIFEEIIVGIDEMPMVDNVVIDDELFESFLFIQPVEDYEALASESLMSSVAHSAVLLRLPEGSDVEKVKSEIRENMNPSKWICVGAEKSEVISHGNTILLVMSFEDITDKMVENFNKLWE